MPKTESDADRDSYLAALAEVAELIYEDSELPIPARISPDNVRGGVHLRYRGDDAGQAVDMWADGFDAHVYEQAVVGGTYRETNWSDPNAASPFSIRVSAVVSEASNG